MKSQQRKLSKTLVIVFTFAHVMMAYAEVFYVKVRNTGRKFLPKKPLKAESK